MKLKRHLLLALVTTVLLTVALIAGPGAASGYGGLFFLFISPLLWVAFLLWGLILQSIVQKQQWLDRAFFFVILTFLAIVACCFCLLTFSSDKDVQSIGYAEIFLDGEIMACFVFASLAYGLLFKQLKKGKGEKG